MINNLKFNKKKLVSVLLATSLSLNGGLSFIGKNNSANADSSEKKYEDLPIICQNDDIFHESNIKYNGHYFSSNGCGPSSTVNMLISLFDYKNDDILPFVNEVLEVFCINHSPMRNSISPDNIIKFLSNDYIISNSDKYPILSSEIKKKNSEVYTFKRLYSLDELKSIKRETNKSFISMGKVNINEKWGEIINTVCNLYDLREYNANLMFSFVSVGKDSCTHAPFHTDGTAGHYVAMTINVKEFYEQGSFCLLDSYQRAIFDETYGTDEDYKTAYPFVSKKEILKDFNEYFKVNRIGDNVIKVSLNDEYVDILNSIKNNENIIKYLEPMYQKVIFYGTSLLVIDVPNKVKVKGNLQVEEELSENHKRI